MYPLRPISPEGALLLAAMAFMSCQKSQADVSWHATEHRWVRPDVSDPYEERLAELDARVAALRIEVGTVSAPLEALRPLRADAVHAIRRLRDAGVDVEEAGVAAQAALAAFERAIAGQERGVQGSTADNT